MSSRLSFKPALSLPSWRVCLCVLLMAFVVYNPFAALSGSSGHLSCERMARHRASIGSSELQHFSPVSNPDVHTDLEVDVRGAEPAPCVQENQPGRDQLEIIPSEPALLAGVWFRPPPSL